MNGRRPSCILLVLMVSGFWAGKIARRFCKMETPGIEGVWLICQHGSMQFTLEESKNAKIPLYGVATQELLGLETQLNSCRF